ncbi:hypothetical protein AAMO2058_000883500 [Amorphochlora amoebiformis]
MDMWGQDVPTVKYLMVNGEHDINAVTKDGYTPLHYACEEGNVEISRLLVESKANLEASERKYGKTPLLYACYLGKLAVVQYLVKVKANVKAVDRFGRGPLHIAVLGQDVSTVKYLMVNGEHDINAVTKDGYTPLHIACGKGNVEILRLLVESKAKLEVSERILGKTPFLYACYLGKLAVVQYLVKVKANVKAVDRYGYGPLHNAVLGQDVSTVKYLMVNGEHDINAVTKDGFTPLLLACQEGKFHLVEYLIKAKANVKATSRFGDGALDLAITGGHASVLKYLVENVKTKVKSVKKTVKGVRHLHTASKQVPLIDSPHRLARKHQEEEAYFEILD